jgi:hypothetical protein
VVHSHKRTRTGRRTALKAIALFRGLVRVWRLATPSVPKSGNAAGFAQWCGSNGSADKRGSAGTVVSQERKGDFPLCRLGRRVLTRTCPNGQYCCGPRHP